MPQNSNAIPPADLQNPYVSPKQGSEVGQASIDGDLERIRNTYLKHEASIQGIGTLYVLGGGLSILLCMLYLAMGIGAFLSTGAAPETMIGGAILLVLAVAVGGIGAAQLWTGIGLRKIRSNARIPGIIFACIGLLGVPIGTLISCYFLYVLASQKGTYVFSPEYASVIQQTPHIKYKTSVIVWILLGLLLLLIGIGVISAVLGSAG